MNRLSRNSVESGELQHLLQNKIIKEIRTPEKSFLPEDNVIVFLVESGVANQYIVDLRKNVNRGMNSKIEKGEFPGRAPMGYQNHPKTRKIVRDEQYWGPVRRMWDLALENVHTLEGIANIMNDEGFRTPKTKKTGGVPLKPSTVHKVLTNVLYRGDFAWKGEIYTGEHEPMVTREEYERVQDIFSSGIRRNSNGGLRHNFMGMFKCGECGCAITAETKNIERATKTHTYKYYHCTRKRGDCSQTMYLRESKIVEQLTDILSTIDILPVFKEWALEELRHLNQENCIEANKELSIINQQISKEETKLTNGLDLFISGDISKDEHEAMKKRITEHVTQLKEKRKRIEQVKSGRDEQTEEIVDFVTLVTTKFKNANQYERRDIVQGLGSKLLINNNAVDIDLHPWFTEIQKFKEDNKAEIGRFETQKNRSQTELKSDFDELKTKWGPQGESNSRFQDENLAS